MKSKTLFIEDDNLSIAWAKAFLALMEPGINRITPLVITLTGIQDGQPTEIVSVRDELDKFLIHNGGYSIRSTANTIFPQSYWNPSKERSVLFIRYLQALPAIKKLDSRNKYGLYFQRLIAFGHENKRYQNRVVNQLEYIISTYTKGNHRPSALQASVLDPYHDHTNQRQRGFPCLQQVSFIPNPSKSELEVTGFYANQYIIDRAYGNYLGLCRLGHFMAHELGYKLSRMTCITSTAELGRYSKRDLMALMHNFEEITVEKLPEAY